MGGAKALREAPGRATNVAKTRSERSDKRRDGAKRKVSEGSSLRLAMVAARAARGSAGQGVGEERARGNAGGEASREAGGEASREAGSGGSRVVGEAGGRLCPRETHGRPWPCEWVARRHCVKRRGERQYVAKTRNERRDERRDGAKRKVSEGTACAWRWWQRRRGRAGPSAGPGEPSLARRRRGSGGRRRRGGAGRRGARGEGTGFR